MFADVDVLGLAIAVLGGTAVGLERQWSGHAAAGPSGLLARTGQVALAAIALAGAVALLRRSAWPAVVTTSTGP
jgi:hypothetical protein